MDPVSMVVAALVAGLTAGVTDTAKTAVMEIFRAFKTRLMPKVESNDEAKSALDALEKKPGSEGRQLVMKEELENLKVDKDAELIHLAKTFLEQLDQKGARAGKYVITIQNAQGTVIGNQNTIRQNFTNRSGKNRGK